MGRLGGGKSGDGAEKELPDTEESKAAKLAWYEETIKPVESMCAKLQEEIRNDPSMGLTREKLEAAKEVFPHLEIDED